jgi:1,4-alpha-glucan branching enzyme
MPASVTHITADTPMGATLVADGATFRVWAPHASAVHVGGSFNGFTPAEESSLVPGALGYWHGFIPGVADRDTYKYWVTGPAGAGWKRDPYARELLEPNWDCVVRATSFPWHDTGFRAPAFNDLVIYQLHVGAFYTPRFPLHAGSFLDVVDKIPYLADLGINAVQLLPIQEFPGDFSLGYNGTDYYSPEMAYGVADQDLPPYLARVNALLEQKGLAPYARADLLGEMNQLKALVDLCHAYGLAVVFDLVFNHAGGGFGDETIWFFDRQEGIDEPRWWNSLYFSDKTWSGGVVFDFQSDAVRAFLIDNATFYLDEYRVDGFRFDEVSVIDRNSYGRGWDFCQALTGTLRAHRPGALVHAEYWNVNPAIVREQWDGNGAGFHTTMTDGPRIAVRALLAAASVPGGQPLPMTTTADQLPLDYFSSRWRGVNSLENHDLVMQPKDANDHNRLERIARVADPSNPRSWYACSRARVATGLLLTMPGIPMLFMGQEFLEDKQWSDDVSGHPELRLFWDGLEGDDPTMRDFLRCVRELLGLRRGLPALRSEGYARLHVHDENRVLAFQRWVPGEGGDVVVILNLSNTTMFGYEIGFPAGGYWREMFNSDVYQQWVNPAVQGNGGGIWAGDTPRDGLAHSAALTLPATALLIFAR